MKTPEQFIKEQQSGVLLKDYSLKDMIWFMEKYVAYCNEFKDKKIERYVIKKKHKC